MGAKVNFLPIPFFRKDKVEAKSSKAHRRGFWEFISEKVTRFPIIRIVAIGAPMLVASFFYFEIETGLNGVDTFPEGTQTRNAFFVMEKEFSFGLVNPTEVVIEGDINNPGVQAAIDELRTSPATLQNLQLLPGPVVNATGDLAVLTVIIQGEPRSQPAVDVVSAIRDEHILAAFDGVDAEVLVGGVSAEAADVLSIVADYTPIVFAFVLGFSFLILMLVFRSIVISCDEPPFGGHRLRTAGSSVSKGGWNRAAGIPTRRCRRCVDTLFLVLHTVRAFHGLPRISAQPHP